MWTGEEVVDELTEKHTPNSNVVITGAWPIISFLATVHDENTTETRLGDSM